MKQRRNELFAGAGLAANEHGDVAATDLARVVEDPLERRALADDRTSDRAFERVIGRCATEHAGLERARHTQPELVERERLREIVVRALLQRLDRGALVALRGEHDDGKLGVRLAARGEE